MQSMAHLVGLLAQHRHFTLEANFLSMEFYFRLLKK